MPRGSKPKIYPPQMVTAVSRLYAAGRTQVEIAKILNVTQKVIWRLMRNHKIQARVAAKRDQRGPKNDSWKGTEAGYQAKHRRVASLRGKPQKCEICGTDNPQKTYDWACVNGDFDDVMAYVRMCRSCHWKHDGTIKNLEGG